MKHLQLYESFDNKNVNYYLDKLSKIDTKKLVIILNPYKGQLNKLFKKYSKNNTISLELINKDLNFLNEGFVDIVKILKNILFLPFNIIKHLINIISDLSINLIGKSIISIVSAIMLFLIGLMVHDVVDQSMNGIGVGVCKIIEFVPEHYEKKTNYYTDAQGNLKSYETNVFVPDTWNATVNEPNTGRIEVWSTTEEKLGTSSYEKDILRKENGWGWKGTIKYGVKPSGKFSGGGAGEDF